MTSFSAIQHALHEAMITDAKRLADEHCRRAIATAERATSPEYVRSDDATGKPLLIPARAMALGMLGHLKDAYERNHLADRDDDIGDELADREERPCKP